MIYILSFIFLFSLEGAYALEIPENSKLNSYTNEWECVDGFLMKSGNCEKIEIPENASLIKKSRYSILKDKDNLGWKCDQGYRRINNECNKIEIPKNAEFKPYSNEWECNKGFIRESDSCKKIIVPKNASLTKKNHYSLLLNEDNLGWKCDQGYKKIENKCAEIEIPKNAKFEPYSNKWECNKGFIRKSDSCKKIIVPKNASLIEKSKFPFSIKKNDTGWKCNKGFTKINSQCQKINLPENAKLDFSGNDWMCVEGFKKVDKACEEMSLQEKKALETRKKMLKLARAKQRAKGSCTKERKSGAEVCLKVNDTKLQCDESLFGNHYDSCELELKYRLQTDHRGESYLNVDVNCQAEIEFSEKDSYLRDDESETHYTSHMLSKGAYIYRTMTIEFDFSSFDEPIKVEVEEVNCRISNVTL